MTPPDIRYVWSGDIALAYRITGTGPVDLLHIPGFTSNVELDWESPKQSAFLRRLASFSRLITMDRRGWGCSDRLSPGAFPPLEVLADDVEVVLDAIGSRRTAVFASGDNGFLAMLFAASHPDRISSLVLYETTPSYLAREDMPWLLSRRDLEDLRVRVHGWGTYDFARTAFTLAGPTAAEDEREFDWYARWVRQSCTPGSAVAEIERYAETDLRHVLPSIRVPTLVIYRRDAPGWPLETARYIASKIDGARLVELPGSDLAHWYGDMEGFADAIEGFITGVPPAHDQGRVLATVVFTDIVSSTERAAEVGDREWGNLLRAHHRIVRDQIARFGGREVDTAGDGFLMTFDGPARAVRCAQAIVDGVRDVGLQIRAGCHTGEIEFDGEGVRGLAVHIGARVMGAAEASEVMVSNTVKDLVAGSGLTFMDRGDREFKGVPGRWHVYAVRRD